MIKNSSENKDSYKERVMYMYARGGGGGGGKFVLITYMKNYQQ